MAEDFPKEIKDFIVSLTQLDNLGDHDAEDVDNALAVWIRTHYPGGFEFDFNRRDLMIRMIRKAAKLAKLIMTSPLRPYLKAIIDMKWRQFCEKEIDRYKRAGKKIDERAVLMRFMEDVFILGYSLRCLEEADKNAKDS